MYAFRSIKGKILFFSGLCFVASIGAVIGYAALAAHDSAKRNALEQAASQATIAALRIQGRIATGLDATQALALAAEGLMQLPDAPPRRDQLIAIQHRMALANQDFLGVWTGWEPDAFDGDDATAAGSDGSTASGRFLPYWNRVGGLHLQAIVADPDAGAWYTASRDTGRITVQDPYTYDMQGAPVTMVSLTAPIRPQAKAVGVAGIDLEAGFLQQLADSVELLGSRADVTLITHSGTIAAKSGAPEFTGKPLRELYADAAEHLRRLEQGRPFHLSDQGWLRIFVPLSFAADGPVWCVNVSLPEAVIYTEARALALRCSLIGLASLAAAMLVLWAIAGMVARPVRETLVAVNRIAEGDLQAQLTPRGRDEVAAVQQAINAMAARLAANIGEIESQVALARDKTVQAEQAMAEAEHARKDAERARAEGLLHAVGRLESVVTGLSATSACIARQVQDIRQGTDVQKQRIAATATAMEEMNATVLEVAHNAGSAAEGSLAARDKAMQGAAVVRESIEAMAMVQARARALRDAMSQLDRQAQSIGAIMTVIDDIADQTNLLALNAAIEAARAGDAGRGFAVVADEVRKLAEKTMHATQEVGDSILAIQKVASDNIASMELAVGGLDEAVERAGHSGEVLQAIVGGTDDSASRIQGIATAAEEQSAASDEIHRAIDEINAVAIETSQGVEASLTAMHELTRLSAELSDLIGELRAEA